MPARALRCVGIFKLCALCCVQEGSIGTLELAVIIVLALVALFIGLRLYSVLGERTGHEQQPILKPADPDARVEQRPVQPAVVQPTASDGGDMAYLPTAGPGVRAILAADPTFDVARFLEGAQSAYRMILEAFWKGDRDELRHLVGGHVLAAFEEAIGEREAEGHKLDNRLVAIERAAIEDARLSGKLAEIEVRFDAYVAAVTRDKDGELVAGSLSDAVPTKDIWTFQRNLASKDPNWLLVETDEAA